MKLIVIFSQIYCLCVLAQASQTSDKFVYVSDIDDTIKITNVKNASSAAYNGIFSRKAFSGMPTLYRQLNLSSTTSGIDYLSGSGDYLNFAIHSFLKKNEFPNGSVYLKRNILDSIAKHKIKILISIIHKLSKNEKLILIGDDTQNDSAIYQEIANSYPDLVEDIFIRRITGKRIPANQKSFITAFEIAANEFNQNRLSIEAAISIGTIILFDKNSEKIIPTFMSCDIKTDKTKSNEPVINQLSKKIFENIFKICSSRHLIH